MNYRNSESWRSIAANLYCGGDTWLVVLLIDKTFCSQNFIPTHKLKITITDRSQRTHKKSWILKPLKKKNSRMLRLPVPFVCHHIVWLWAHISWIYLLHRSTAGASGLSVCCCQTISGVHSFGVTRYHIHAQGQLLGLDAIRLLLGCVSILILIGCPPRK